jgi:PAS domain S-box-containing protein
VTSVEARLLEEPAEELFEEAPCGYLATRPDGTIIKINRTLEQWLGRPREELIGQVRFQELLTPGGRIYHDTHYAPLLQMQGAVREIAVELIKADGSSLPALINSVLHDEQGHSPLIRTIIFDATDRRRYEQELLRAAKREREIASTLQHSLLSGELPTSPALQIAVYYKPATEGLEIGGDWYDAFWLEPQRTLALVVGDVVGRGLHAAATMGQLRSAVRALASLRPSPPRVLEALDAYSRQHNLGHMTTLAYAEIDLEKLELRYSCAGHPPPLLLEPGRKPRFLWGGRSVPINPYGLRASRREAVSPISPGSCVLLYTDGLVENRRQAIDTGMNDLAAVVSKHQTLPLETMLSTVAHALSRTPEADDQCLLCAKVGIAKAS